MHAMMANSSALRRGRFSQVGGVYLVTTVTHGRQPLFADFWLARITIEQLRSSDAAGKSQTMAYVLMPDHLHWLVTLNQGSLSALVGSFKANAARQVNDQLGTGGQAIWQSGFHDRAMRRDEDLAGVGRYIVHNSVRAGLVPNARQFPHWDAVWV
jgi:putative transposase